MSISPTLSASAPPTMNLEDTLKKFAPRAVFVMLGSYYGLGWAYVLGIMAAIDRIAINLLKDWVGYAGIGAWMPTVQWYAAGAVRITMGLLCGVLYHLIEKVLICIKDRFCCSLEEEPPKEPASEV